MRRVSQAFLQSMSQLNHQSVVSLRPVSPLPPVPPALLRKPKSRGPNSRISRIGVHLKAPPLLAREVLLKEGIDWSVWAWSVRVEGEVV